tara:strand:- start:1744 stop:2676 length:933 start_codon:yes stop_codon:yes gene_type:complete
MNEKDKQAFASVVEKLNSVKEAEKVKIRNHIAKLNKLKSLEDKLNYWTTHLRHRSLLQGIGEGEERTNLLEGASNRSERLDVVKAEISRLDATNKDFLSVRFRNKFYDRIKETNDIELTKTKFIEKIHLHVGGLKLTNKIDKHKEKGYKAYLTGTSIESKLEDLQFHTIGLESRLLFKHTYEGYLLAELEGEIKAYSKSEETGSTNDNRIEVNIPAERFAALMYILSTKGVFDLVYFDFNTNDYNGEETSKLCQKHFKIISQKGSTTGQEVSIGTLTKAFKKSIINANLENGIDNLFKALVSLPKLTKKG